MQIDAILFDKDGTLFDFAATWEAFARSLLTKLAEGDPNRAAQLGEVIGFDLHAGRYHPDSIVIAGTTSEVVEMLAPSLPGMTKPGLTDMLNREAALAPQTEAVPLVPFLDNLRNHGLRLGIATNDSEAPARVHLGAAGVLDRFDFIAGYDSGHGAKPEPGQLLAFAAHIDVAPEHIAMVGDSTHDLKAGRAAGMRTVGVLTGVAPADELAPYADVVLANVGEIPAWLGL
ncbi:HAD family hydrolase [Ruegeria sp. 2012CJ41-6]|uniref:phosphoglycolate phosphatase n=1 Tax=Ruegeria spongiae TaxID=2942209 RepID=A0ABT0Q258_9RHOB|nr:HAD family hydrolase [Ruegeria spongiae]MCL6283949.1 HAD family hydrolase [Ruegeria spongiae]